MVNITLKKLFNNWYLRDDSRSVINPNRPIINVNPIIYFYQSQYYSIVSLYLSKQLKKLFNQYFKDLKLIFAYRSIRMHDFFCFKDRVPERLCSRVVYKFTCRRCNSTYVGKTNRHMRTRACEHMGISPLTAANVKTTPIVHNHFILTSHMISFNDFIILRSVSDRHSLLIHKHLFIKSHKLNLNAQ